MAVLATHTTLDISGKHTINKSLTDSNAVDSILKAQGVGMLKRTAAGLLSPTLHIKHYKDADGVKHIEVEPHVPSGPALKVEARTLTWTEQSSESPIVAAVTMRTRRVKAEEIRYDFLKSGWTADTLEYDLIEAEMCGTSDTKWTVDGIWGVEELQGERRHCRHIRCTGAKGQIIEAKFVYDYAGPL